jgi:hypothetical protein
MAGEGIHCVVQNELLAFATELGQEPWAGDDQDDSKAKEIVDNWEGSITERPEAGLRDVVYIVLMFGSVLSVTR